eukprot:TRINITY_DN3030_c4_g6_i1.p1 TRINITY_DN3030_c4_g6~~TRINITY_DN3030_c4_g6_i1.p1  ORF type:complete len:53 (-),score=11.36 TRINITY_DN3030_c4_g6_i1:56-214(-)
MFKIPNEKCYPRDFMTRSIKGKKLFFPTQCVKQLFFEIFRRAHCFNSVEMSK